MNLFLLLFKLEWLDRHIKIYFRLPYLEKFVFLEWFPAHVDHKRNIIAAITIQNLTSNYEAVASHDL